MKMFGISLEVYDDNYLLPTKSVKYSWGGYAKDYKKMMKDADKVIVKVLEEERK
jgi:hypothetical protein